MIKNNINDGRGQALKAKKAADQAIRIEKLKPILKSVKGIEFENVTKLSEHLSKLYKAEYDEVITPSTLRRNPLYRRFLDKHMDKIELPANELANIQQDLILANSEIFDLERELATTKKVLSQQLSEVSKLKQLSLAERTDGIDTRLLDDSPFELIVKLLDAVEDFKVERSGLYNLASVKAEPPLVVERDMCPRFFDWYFKKT